MAYRSYSRRSFLRFSIGTVLLSQLPVIAAEKKAKRPNVLWLSSEDFSPHLGCYGDANAKTPAIDQFAKEGVRFTRAFTVHGVCAPVRSSIITGVYPSSLGSCAMRCAADIPESPVCFPEALRQAGYYCTNNSKEDYNFQTPKSVWDESSKKAHYRNRPDGKPFFAVFNFVETHESKLWNSVDFEKTHPKGLSEAEYQSPDAMVVPPIYPDSPVVRRDLARLYERITEFDHFVRDKLSELKANGLEDETIVFIWSDHGDGLPRFKRCLYETGTHVPLLVRIPERFRLHGQGIAGTTDDQIVNLFQLGPTVLNLAGVKPLPRMQAKAFLGPDLPKPAEYLFGARDRIDEFFDLVRAVRDRRYRLIRNLNPWVSYFPNHEYGDRCNTLQEMRRLYAAGKLPPSSAQWMASRRPAEELYDLDADPYEIRNLAENPDYHAVKERLGRVLTEWMVQTRDTGLLPEPILRSRSKEVGSAYAVLGGTDGETLTRRLAMLAFLASNPKPADTATFAEALSDTDPAVRYWAAVGLGQIKDADAETSSALEKATADSDGCVRIAAARSLYWHGQRAKGVSVLCRILTTEEDENVLHLALNVLDFLGCDLDAETMEPIRRLSNSDKNKGYLGRILSRLLKAAS
jgi:uncharacterized sulfatase